MKRLQFKLQNILWSCDRDHKKYDEGDYEVRDKMLNKIKIIKKDPELIYNLNQLYRETPLLKNQNIKEYLKKEIEKIT